MYIKLILSKQLILNIFSLQDCTNTDVLYIPKVHAFGSLLLTHTLLVQTHIHNVSAPGL